MAVPIITRRTAACPAKSVVEAADGTKTGVEGNIHNLLIGSGEQTLGV
jgi:hypothetical protein